MAQFIQRIISSKRFLLYSGLLYAISSIVILAMNKHLQNLNSGARSCPDLRFGYTPDEVYAWAIMLGDNGRTAYLKMVLWDFFPYMESYTMFYGSLLFNQCKKADVPTKVALLFPFAMLGDVIETSLSGYAVKRFPDRIDDGLLFASSIGNKFKWVSFGLGTVTLIVLALYNSRCRMHNSSKKE